MRKVCIRHLAYRFLSSEMRRFKQQFNFPAEYVFSRRKSGLARRVGSLRDAFKEFAWGLLNLQRP